MLTVVATPSPVLNLPASARSGAGFSLLEVLVAFTIMALSLGVLLNIITSVTRANMVTSGYSHALIIAESQMAVAGIESPLQTELVKGESQNGRFHWQRRVTPCPLQICPQQAESPIPAYIVAVSVVWEGRELLLESLRLGEAAVVSQRRR
ncbi:MAG: prepilin-type N-terminal cleavage/methylation domain-containing protein [Gammaproteobacteria bacterium]|nr:prepilin-type N-terminal cleavage/methylation domain-containing protein [Gammaproteobacteria bacterium]